MLREEAEALGYPLWLLRLALATYRLPRTIRVGGAYSILVVAFRGITAGSGLATTDMRLAMIRIVDRACAKFKSIEPCLFVDDLSAEDTGTEKSVEGQLSGVGLQVCDDITAAEMEVSGTKSFCTASSPSLGNKIADNIAKYAVTYHAYVKSLGTGLGAGIRRNTSVLKKRLL